MTTMQDMFDLNTAIDQLKNCANKDYNFEVKDGELETNIHLFTQTESYPQIVQDAYTQFNRTVKAELQKMIDKLTDERDRMTMKILANQPLPAPKVEDQEAFQCDGLDCGTCLVPDCPKLHPKDIDEPSK